MVGSRDSVLLYISERVAQFLKESLMLTRKQRELRIEQIKYTSGSLWKVISMMIEGYS